MKIKVIECDCQTLLIINLLTQVLVPVKPKVTLITIWAFQLRILVKDTGAIWHSTEAIWYECVKFNATHVARLFDSTCRT